MAKRMAPTSRSSSATGDRADTAPTKHAEHDQRQRCEVVATEWADDFDALAHELK